MRLAPHPHRRDGRSPLVHPPLRIPVAGGEALGQALILVTAVLGTGGLVLAEHWWRTGELGLTELLARAAAVVGFFAVAAGLALLQAWVLRAVQRAARARARRPWPVADIRTWQERSAPRDWNARVLATAGAVALSLMALRACDDASTWLPPGPGAAAVDTVAAEGSR